MESGSLIELKMKKGCRISGSPLSLYIVYVCAYLIITSIAVA